MERTAIPLRLMCAWLAMSAVQLADTAPVPVDIKPQRQPLFTFMQFSDVHVGNDANRPVHKRLVAAVELANAMKPAFVIDTGDITTRPVYALKDGTGEGKQIVSRSLDQRASSTNVAEWGGKARVTGPS